MRRRKQLKAQRLQVSLVELRQTVAVGLINLSHVLDNRLREREQLAIGAPENLPWNFRLSQIFGVGNRIPSAAVFFLPLGIGGNFCA